MGLFRRGGGNADSNGDGAQKKEKGSWRRPANTAFKQQRLKAWQPILTPKTVLPTLFIIGIIFAPIGALLIWGSSLVSEITIDYTGCENLDAQDSLSSDTTFTTIPSNKFKYSLRSSESSATHTAPKYARINNSSSPDPSLQTVCVVQFDVPINLDPSVLLYYKLTNFYQNHRRYVKSFDSDQLKGKNVSASTINGGDCKPVDTVGSKIIYPCGLIANSIFNDTFSNLTNLGSNDVYAFSERGIAWPGEAKKYASTPGYSADEIVPPPNWYNRYPQGYNDSNLPDLHNDEHFQNWMRTAGLPTFSKLYGRNDADTLVKGTYQITIGLNFPVQSYHGTKSIVISTVSWIGGKNNFLGWAYIASSGLFVFLAIAGTIRHLLKPRRVGDMSLLSWNR
ncbi:Lem3/Cdc50 [Gloeophyllum trabeum ATCC 11539]|uniref:Lem3/Cdc50 n=1 Tax=Gloeophyllum trabeum (strain ATCC 11539 / FP-39264 / Madison 617) TaxID=670483 RepID=S7PR57_GLOTA|nr:Lem3/Cdc50 [Gloeophyllum trabeum ATCC 11539]EPQ49963.1 Lem3/Cdc50 [Gloeophyllum trabeum ATCC 11539]